MIPPLPPDSPFVAIQDAIVSGDEATVRDLRHALHAQGDLPESQLALIWAIVEHDRQNILHNWWPVLHPHSMTQALVGCIEWGRPELGQWINKNTPDPALLQDAMLEASDLGLPGTVKKLLAADVPFLRSATNQSCLARAAQRNHLDVLDLFLPKLSLVEHEQVIGHALGVGTRARSTDCVLRLWPLASTKNQACALREAALGGHLELILQLTENWQPELTDAVRVECAKALHDLLDPRYVTFDATHRAVFDRLLPWADANHDGALILRRALLLGATDLIEPLLRVSDPQIARAAMARERPVRWDLIVELGKHVPLEIRSLWLKKDKVHLNELRAIDRAERAGPLIASPDGPPSVRRPRSRS